MLNTTEYLTASVIRDDPWVKKVCTSNSAEELADLFLKRFSFPGTHGPYCFQSADAESPAEIIFDLVTYAYVDCSIAEESILILMKKILTNEISSPYIMENVFYLIEQLVVEICSSDLFEWLKNNPKLIGSHSSNDRKLFLNASNALVYAQKINDPEILKYWISLWETEDQSWWNVAFHGVRHSDLDKAISMIPELMDRRCSDVSMLLKSVWRSSSENSKITTFLKEGIRNNKRWAGEAINIIADKMKWAEKACLIEKLFDSSSNVEDDDDYFPLLGS